MKHNLILVVTLLATLSMINAIPHQLNKRATTFAECPPGFAPNVLTATLQPDPPVAGQDCVFTVGGTFPIAVGSKLAVQGADSADNAANPVGEILIGDICTTGGVKCPTDGTAFSIVQTIPIPAVDPSPAAYAITVVDPTGKIMGCTHAIIG